MTTPHSDDGPRQTSATVLADSDFEGVRLTTLHIRFPRIILAQLTRHRVFSFSVASNRARLGWDILNDVERDPFVPEIWRRAQKGMTAGGRMRADDAQLARRSWLRAAKVAVWCAQQLVEQHAAKEHVNRLLEPFQWCEAVVSATEWTNFFNLRIADDAQPEIQELARAIFDAMTASEPDLLVAGQWHIPWITEPFGDSGVCGDVTISAGQMARVSYRLEGGESSGPAFEADFALGRRLIADQHWSPFEHQAEAGYHPRAVCGNFGGDYVVGGRDGAGWAQARHLIAKDPDEWTPPRVGRRRPDGRRYDRQAA